MSDDELAFKASYHYDAARCLFPIFCVNFKSTHISYMFIFPTNKVSIFPTTLHPKERKSKQIRNQKFVPDSRAQLGTHLT